MAGLRSGGGGAETSIGSTAMLRASGRRTAGVGTVCPVGSYCPGAVVAAATPCPDGTYSSVLNATLESECGGFPCDAGYMCGPGTSEVGKHATPCPPETFCVAGTGTSSAKAACPDGTDAAAKGWTNAACDVSVLGVEGGADNVGMILLCVVLGIFALAGAVIMHRFAKIKRQRMKVHDMQRQKIDLAVVSPTVPSSPLAFALCPSP